ncbi:MAG: DUF4230 domain-containing protein [Sphingomonadaceae bacterium]
MKRLLPLVGMVALLCVAIGGAWYWWAGPSGRQSACERLGLCPAPADVIGTALQSVQRQQQLVVFSARLITAVTARSERTLLGKPIITAQKTLIVPGTVRYAVDLQKLEAAHVRWDGATETLSIARPPLRLLGPEAELTQAMEYADGAWAIAMAGGAAALDKSNRDAATRRLIEEARKPALMALAQQAADDALARTFALPLHAAGFADAKVVITAPVL